MAIKTYNQLKIFNLVTMATTTILSKLFLMLINEVVMNIFVSGIFFRTNIMSLAIKLYNQLTLWNLVTMATTKNVYNPFFYA